MNDEFIVGDFVQCTCGFCINSSNGPIKYKIVQVDQHVVYVCPLHSGDISPLTEHELDVIALMVLPITLLAEDE